MKKFDFDWILRIIGIAVCVAIFKFADLTTNPAFVNFIGAMFTIVVLFSIVIKVDESGNAKAESKNEAVD